MLTLAPPPRTRDWDDLTEPEQAVIRRILTQLGTASERTPPRYRSQAERRTLNEDAADLLGIDLRGDLTQCASCATLLGTNDADTDPYLVIRCQDCAEDAAYRAEYEPERDPDAGQPDRTYYPHED